MLVDYPDSTSESDEPCPDGNRGQKKSKTPGSEPKTKVDTRRPPPLPASFRTLYATNVRTAASDDPSLHAGRTRQVPHAVGNWPTHIYLEWHPSKQELAILDDVIEHARPPIDMGRSMHSFLRSELGALQPLHISLSAPLVLKTDEKGPFQERVCSEVQQRRVSNFTVCVTGLAWVANHDGSRYFLVLKLGKPPNDELNKLLSACNAVARRLGLTELYANQGGCVDENDLREQLESSDMTDAFHISIAWALQEPEKQAQEQLLEVDDLKPLAIGFSELKLKMGNIVVDIPLTKP
ncbi:poly(U)-specific 3'-to-5' RNA exonuclease [Rhinocladiella similis]